MSRYPVLICQDLQLTSIGMKELPPFDSIPMELVQEIFKRCLVDVTQDVNHSNRQCRDVVKKISLVCRKWHEIALAKPELWAHIVVLKYEKNPPLTLLRSKFAPLYVTVESYDESVNRYLFSDAQISRWRVMHIILHELPEKEVVELGHCLEGKSAPQLKMLSFCGKYGIGGNQWQNFVQAVLSLLSTSSKIEYFAWVFLPFPLPSPFSVESSALSRLTTIVLDRVYGSFTADDYIRFLAMCKCAKSFALYPINQIRNPVNLHPVTILPMLEKLGISIRVGVFLPYFTVPSLKKLGGRGDDLSDCDALNECFQRSIFTLTTLSIIFCGTVNFPHYVEQYLRFPWMSSIAEVSFNDACTRSIREALAFLRSSNSLTEDTKCKLAVDISRGIIGWGLQDAFCYSNWALA